MGCSDGTDSADHHRSARGGKDGRGPRDRDPHRATIEERLRRNEGEFRLAEKPSKRDREASKQGLLALDARYRMNTAGEFDGRADYLRLDNTHLPPAAAAEQVISHFDLARVAPVISR